MATKTTDGNINNAKVSDVRVNEDISTHDAAGIEILATAAGSRQARRLPPPPVAKPLPRPVQTQQQTVLVGRPAVEVVINRKPFGFFSDSPFNSPIPMGYSTPTSQFVLQTNSSGNPAPNPGFMEPANPVTDDDIKNKKEIILSNLNTLLENFDNELSLVFLADISAYMMSYKIRQDVSTLHKAVDANNKRKFAYDNLLHPNMKKIKTKP
jgi:hypothetical protein